MNESQQFRAARDWLTKIRAGNLTAHEALGLYAEAPHHVDVLTRIILRLLPRQDMSAVRPTPTQPVAQPQPRAAVVASAPPRMPPPIRKTATTPAPRTQMETEYMFTRDELRRSLLNLVEKTIDELDGQVDAHRDAFGT